MRAIAIVIRALMIGTLRIIILAIVIRAIAMPDFFLIIDSPRLSDLVSSLLDRPLGLRLTWRSTSLSFQGRVFPVAPEAYVRLCKGVSGRCKNFVNSA